MCPEDWRIHIESHEGKIIMASTDQTGSQEQPATTQPGGVQRSERPAKKATPARPAGNSDMLAAALEQARPKRREIAKTDRDLLKAKGDVEAIKIAAHLLTQEIDTRLASGSKKLTELERKAAQLREECGLAAPAASATDDNPDPAPTQDTSDETPAPADDSEPSPDLAKLHEEYTKVGDVGLAIKLTGYSEDKVRSLLNIPPWDELTDDVLTAAYIRKFGEVDSRLENLETAVFGQSQPADNDTAPAASSPNNTALANERIKFNKLRVWLCEPSNDRIDVKYGLDEAGFDTSDMSNLRKELGMVADQEVNHETVGSAVRRRQAFFDYLQIVTSTAPAADESSKLSDVLSRLGGAIKKGRRPKTLGGKKNI
jgi:hypothetical protein